MSIKPSPKPITKLTGKPDRRRRDDKDIPGKAPTLRPHKHEKGG